MSNNRGTRLALFVGTLALVLVGAMVVGFVIADTPPERTDATVENDYFTSEALLEESEMTPRSGDIEFEEGLPGFGLLTAAAAVAGGAWWKNRNQSDKQRT